MCLSGKRPPPRFPQLNKLYQQKRKKKNKTRKIRIHTQQCSKTSAGQHNGKLINNKSITKMRCLVLRNTKQVLNTIKISKNSTWRKKTRLSNGGYNSVYSTINTMIYLDPKGLLTSLLHHFLIVGEKGEGWGETSCRGHRSTLLTCSVSQLKN